MDQAGPRFPDTVIYDVSGTGWSFKDRNSAAWRAGQIDQMNQYRVAAGLPVVNPLRSVPLDVICTSPVIADMLHAQVAAGIVVYLVDFSQPAAKLAAWAAELDHDGGLGDLPAGQTIHLIETDAKTEWAAATVSDVVRLQSSINQLVAELPVVALNPPVRCDTHTVNHDWHPAAIRRAVEMLAAGHVVWTVTLDTPTAVRLAHKAGLPGIGTLDGRPIIASPVDLRRLAQAPTAAEQAERRAAFARGEAQRRAEAQAELERLAGEAFETSSAAAPERNRSATVDGNSDVVADLLAAADRARRDFSMFAWTDRDGCLHTGTFRDLAIDTERRDREDRAAVANVYVMTRDAELVAVEWSIETGSSDALGGGPFQYIVVALPGGRRLNRRVEIGQRRSS